MFCPQCGAPVSEGSRFCMQCGTQMPTVRAASVVPNAQAAAGSAPAQPAPVQPAQTPVQPAQPQAQPMQSPGQPAQAMPSASSAPASSPSSSPASSAAGGRKKLIAIIAAIVAVVAVVVVVIFVAKPFSQNGSSGGVAGEQAAPTDASQLADAVSTQQGAAVLEEHVLTLEQAYAQVLQNHIAAYGPTQITKPDAQVTALDGVALATLYDFNNDGTDELLLSYYDPSRNTMQSGLRSNDSYRVEVWAYDGKEANLVHEQHAESSNGGTVYVSLTENTSNTKDKMPALLTVVDYPDGTIFDVKTTYYGFDGESFVPVKTYEAINGQASGSGKDIYKIDGQEVPKEAYDQQAPYRVLTGDVQPYNLLEFANSSDMSWGYDVESVKELTDETIDGLSAAANVAADSDNSPATNALADRAFADFPRTFVFSSGAGGWSTQITVQKDGTFTGQWQDSDMGDRGADNPNGTMHVCEFEGKFSVASQVSDTEFELQLDYLRPTRSSEEKIEDGVRFIWVDDAPYGLGEMTESPVGGWHLYMPGMSSAGFPDEVTLWWRTEGWDKDAPTLNGYGLVGNDPKNGSTYALFSRG